MKNIKCSCCGKLIYIQHNNKICRSCYEFKFKVRIIETEEEKHERIKIEKRILREKKIIRINGQENMA